MYVYLYDNFLKNKRYDSLIKAIETRLTDYGIAGKIIRLQRYTNCEMLIEDEIRKGAKNIVIVGNDVTFGHVLSRAASCRVTYGFLPVGSENSIADVLGMTVEEAYVFFNDKPAIADKLSLLREVGLGYVELGQPATTLSGGEAQRVKLATELSRASTGKTLYILDEPTTGLHFEDIKHLLLVLNRLVEKGNTVLIIEHNLDVIRCADWIIDLGPEGGRHGGEVVAVGTPEDVAKNKKSWTGKFLS